MKKYILLLSVVFVALFSSCDKSLNSEIPSLPVFLDIRMDLNNLSTPGSYKAITRKPDASSYIGFGGVLIVRGYDVATDAVYAYDLACPYEKIHTTRITVNENNIAVCSTCGSEFNGIFWGSPAPTAGPAFNEKLYLRRYNAFINDFNIIVNN